MLSLARVQFEHEARFICNIDSEVPIILSFRRATLRPRALLIVTGFPVALTAQGGTILEMVEHLHYFMMCFLTPLTDTVLTHGAQASYFTSPGNNQQVKPERR